jgi:hypothetical protein
MHLVSVEVIEGLVTTFRMRTSVAVMWIEAVISVTVGSHELRTGRNCMERSRSSRTGTQALVRY